MAFGKTEEQVRKELGEGAPDVLVKSKVFAGNRPSTSIMFPLLTPATLGELSVLMSLLSFSPFFSFLDIRFDFFLFYFCL